MKRGIHGEKLVSTLANKSLKDSDKHSVQKAINKYDEWINALNNLEENDPSRLISEMIQLLNEYKFYLDVDLVFDSKNDFLYRQKGQLKLDNTVIEEFLPIFVSKYIQASKHKVDFDIEAQSCIFSSAYFKSSITSQPKGGGLTIKTKNQDFSISRNLYLKSSHSKDFEPEKTLQLVTKIGYVMAELKTNLDKTMYQEAAATARDIKLGVTGAKYYLLCDFLDMTPISSTTTDIDEILILRKAKRLNSNIRSNFSTYDGRMKNRDYYINFLKSNPYSEDMFIRFLNHILSLMPIEEQPEEEILNQGFF